MDQIDSLLKRPITYDNIDGVGELGMGFMCLGYTLIGLLQAHTPAGSFWHRMPTFLIYVAVMMSIVHYGSKAIKGHITYPRTGYVEYRRDARWRIMALAFFCGALGSLGTYFVLRRHWHMTTPVALFGLLLAAGYAYNVARTVRWKWAVVCAMGLGSIAIAILPADLLGAVASPNWLGAYWLSFALYGALLSISGGISFWVYLRHQEVPALDVQ